jgi:hypothetical protein
VVAILVYASPATAGIGFSLVLSGIPVYLVWHRAPGRARG